MESQKKKLWIITELYYPENNQTGYYITQIGEGLSDDFDVKVICSQPNYAVRGTIAPRHEIHNHVEIFRVSGTTLDKNVLLYRLVNMLTNGVSVFWAALRRVERGDEVLTISAPPSLPFIAAAAAKLRGAAYSVIIHDKYPEIISAVKKGSAFSLPIKLLGRLNRWLYSNARKVIVVGRDMEELVRAETSKDERIAVIPNWAALEEVEPASKTDNKLLKDLGLTDKFVFLYAGNMGHPQDVESIIDCADKLRDHDAIRFLFIGSGVKRKWIESEIAKKNLDNVRLLDPMPRDKQSLFLNACDVGFVSLVHGMYGVAMPSRTYNLLAAGKPILALTERGSEVERVVLEEDAGWTVEPRNPELLLKAIEEIYGQRDRLPEMSDNARRAAVNKYNSELAIERYRTAMRLTA